MSHGTYEPDELLPLSGIQHFLFCRRQWALIHVERQWHENALTAEGRLMHKRADDPFFTEVRRGILIARSVPVASYTLGLSGVCDVVEFTEAAEGVILPGRAGQYHAAPVEYKRGKPKQEQSDEAQLCAQAICLEEMLALNIPAGYLYYGETRHRVRVELTTSLRELVKDMAKEMQAYFQRGHTPRGQAVQGLSLLLVGRCLPSSIAGQSHIGHALHSETD